MPDNEAYDVPTEVTISSTAIGPAKQIGSAVVDLTSAAASIPAAIPAFPKAHVAVQQADTSVSSEPGPGVEKPYPRWYINALQKTKDGDRTFNRSATLKAAKQGSTAVANVKPTTASASVVTPASFPVQYHPPATASQAEPSALENPIGTLPTHGQPKSLETQVVQRPPTAFVIWDDSLGVDKIEGPYPQWQVPKPVRWIIDRNPTLVFRSSEEASFTVCLRCRCELEDQVARVLINGVAAGTIEFPQTMTFTDVEFSATFLQGENRVALTFSAAFEERQDNCRQLVLLVEDAKATAVTHAAASE